jgi:hypothetical protein
MITRENSCFVDDAIYISMFIFCNTELYFKDLAYTDIYVDGEINGVQNLSLGQGVNFVVGENVSIYFVFKIFFVFISFNNS